MSIQRKIARRIKSRYPVSIPREELNHKGILAVNSAFALAIYAIIVAIIILLAADAGQTLATKSVAFMLLLSALPCVIPKVIVAHTKLDEDNPSECTRDILRLKMIFAAMSMVASLVWSINLLGLMLTTAEFRSNIYAILSVAVLIVGVIIALVDISLIVVENRKFKRKQRRVIGWE